MKTTTLSLLLTFATLTGCSATATEGTSTADALAADDDAARPALVLTGEQQWIDFVYDEDIAPVEATAGEAFDVTNPGSAHVFGVYDGEGRKLDSVTFPAHTTVPFTIATPGDYELTCEDCKSFSDEALAAPDWPSFVAILNAGRASKAVRPSVSVHVGR